MKDRGHFLCSHATRSGVGHSERSHDAVRREDQVPVAGCEDPVQVRAERLHTRRDALHIGVRCVRCRSRRIRHRHGHRWLWCTRSHDQRSNKTQCGGSEGHQDLLPPIRRRPRAKRSRGAAFSYSAVQPFSYSARVLSLSAESRSGHRRSPTPFRRAARRTRILR